MSTPLLVGLLALAPAAAPAMQAQKILPVKASPKPAVAPAPQAAPKPAPQPVAVAQAAPAPQSASQAAPGPEPVAAPVAQVAAPTPAAPTPAAPDWLTQTEMQSQTAEPMQRWPLVLATLLMLAAAGALLMLRVRQGQTLWPGGTSGHAIEILAIKPLGQKHRLVLVEASGERLLLSATEREVRLLSHISSQEGMAIAAQSDGAQVDALTRGMSASPRPAPMVSAPVQQGPRASAALTPGDAPEPAASAFATYMASEPMSVPMVAPQGPASHESLSAEALYEGAARSMDLDEQDDDLDEAQPSAAQERPDALASDVAGLARWRQAAAQGAETWGKQV